MTDPKRAGRARNPFRRAVVAAALLVCAGAAAGAAGASAAKHPLLQHVPAAVASGQAAPVAPLAATRHLKLAVNLPLGNQAELDALLRQLYDPSSPSYHHYLGVDEFTARFAPSQADYDAVVAWAAANGFAVTRTTPNRHIVDLDGSVDAVDRALHVTMQSYRHPSENREFFAPDREPTLDLAVPVLAITGLDDFTLPKPMHKQGAMLPGPVPAASGSGPRGNFLPSDMRAVYYGSGPLTGAGQTVGIFSFEGYDYSDVQLFFTTANMPLTTPINNVLVNGYSGECGGCDDGEQVLDIGNVIGMAPGITQVLFYEGDSGPDILNQMATDNLAKVLSCSWGSSDMGHVADPIYQEFQAQGQTFANATGDDGSYDAQSWLPPSLNPLTLQVGATDLATDGPGGAWVSETGWADAGGGYYAPAGYSIPDYQQLAGVIDASNGGSTTLRNDPDVAAEGNFDNITVSGGQVGFGIGGTSYAAPRWAGFIALANEQSIANGGAVLGFVNPALYAIGVGSDYANDFHDPASGSNGGFHAVAGYDLVTGWGSPNGENLIAALSGPTTTPGFVLAGYPPNPSMTRGSTTSTTITVDALNGFGDDVTLTASGLPDGVTATFSPSTTDTSSVLTFTSDDSAAIGTATVTITGTSGSLTQTTTVDLLVGAAARADVDPTAVAFDHVVPFGIQKQTLSIANAADSIPLTYTAAAYASSGGACTGTVPWLTAEASGSVNGGQSADFGIEVSPAGTLAIGSYTGEVCVTTNDPTQPVIAIPISVTIVPGPATETLFKSGFETGETNTGTRVTYTIDMPAENDQAGSALDLATGNYHTWDPTIVDNINPYNDGGTGLQFYWYDDAVPGAFSHRVGGALDANGKFAVLHSGDTIGPDSTFSNAATTAIVSNWRAGADGYIGIAFLDSRTGALNYGYIHLTTTSPRGFPAQVLEYGFDDSGAAITIP
ncbi:MAG TPA: S53 family peptidase [Dokdonella sp.]